jgi:hypothetical protein
MKIAVTEKNSTRDNSELPTARLIAFYLPQFHSIPENDEWWGKGFTEWTNVTKAKPLFYGHHQPNLPADLGFYDLRVPEIRIAQAEMAKQYGIEGFCYWHYWFSGKRLLERPFNEVLKSGEPDFPFCLGWANETWGRSWHGCPNKILMKQEYPGLEDYTSHFYEVLNALTDHRYMKVDNKPIFLVYQPQKLPNPQEFTDHWRGLAVKEGLQGIYFIGVESESWIPQSVGFDASTSANPKHIIGRLPKVGVLEKLSNRLKPDKLYLHQKIYRKQPSVIDYAEIMKYILVSEELPFENYPCIYPNWDNTPRSGVRGWVMRNSTPDLFRIHLQKAIDKVALKTPQHQLIFVKSWNEWAEGNYLEPDQKFGRAYLEVVRDEVLMKRSVKKEICV